MKTIKRKFKTLKQAENCQFKLYDMFSYVRLIEYPSFTEEGIYIWQVSNIKK